MIVTSDKVSDDCSRGDSTKCIEYERREEATGISAISSGGPHRHLNNRHIQLTAIGGTIGTGLFIRINGELARELAALLPGLLLRRLPDQQLGG